MSMIIFTAVYPIILLLRFANEEPGELTGEVGSFFHLGLYPLLAILTNLGGEALECYHQENSLTFARDHLLSLALPFLGTSLVYFYCRYRKHCAPPLIEVLLNGILLVGVLLHVLVGYQYFGGSANLFYIFFIWIIPGAITLLVIQLVRNHQLLIAERFGATPQLVGDEACSDYQTEVGAYQDSGFYRMLTYPLFIKSPLLLVAMIPYIVALDAFLLLFGQQPDSIMLVFTQTYYKGFSELRPVCNIIPYESHYLCSVAANGHASIVKPLRMGVRGGKAIVCNRQLLVANAFEELLQEHFPRVHRLIRRHYDRLGNFLHKDYTPYENRYLCDLIYLLMKPADWCFRLVLYTCDRRPEERIARQYLPR